MKYYIKLIIEGDFPGSPDNDYVQIKEEEYDFIRWLHKGKWCDTKEQAETWVI